jgi:hypothetical protein
MGRPKGGTSMPGNSPLSKTSMNKMNQKDSGISNHGMTSNGTTTAAARRDVDILHFIAEVIIFFAGLFAFVEAVNFMDHVWHLIFGW